MEIVIDSRFKLVTDRTGWELYQYRPAAKGPNAGKPGWYSEGHYDTLPWALRGAVRYMLHEGRGTATLEQLAGRIEQVEERIMQALERYAGLPYRSDRSDVRELRPIDRVGPWQTRNRR